MSFSLMAIVCSVDSYISTISSFSASIAACKSGHFFNKWSRWGRDILIALPEAVYFKTNPSDVLLATTKLRFGTSDAKDVLQLEKVISGAFGDEKDTILMLPEFYSDSLKYGIGGHFCYWRGLVYENDGMLDMAKRDFSLARKCGVIVPKRSWE